MNTENVGRITISVLVVIAFIAYLVGIIRIPIPTEMREMVNTAGGFLAGAFTMVVGYWVGSSAGSAAKDKTITTLSNKP